MRGHHQVALLLGDRLAQRQLGSLDGIGRRKEKLALASSFTRNAARSTSNLRKSSMASANAGRPAPRVGGGACIDAATLNAASVW
jgi:hypothetical protein